MAKAGFWKTEWFLGLSVSLFMLLAAAGGLLPGLERPAYDLALRLVGKTPSDRVAVILLDEPAAWSRARQARLIDLLAGAKAQVVASTLSYAAPEINPANVFLARLGNLLEPAAAPELAKAAELVAEAKMALDGDAQLVASLTRAGNVLLPMLPAATPAGMDKVPPFVLASRLPVRAEASGVVVPPAILQVPIESIGSRALGLGVLAFRPDADAVVRKEHLLVELAGQIYPALSLAIVARSLGVAPEAIVGRSGRDVRLGKLRIPIDRTMAMHPRFYPFLDGRPPFSIDFLADVESGKVPASKYAGKIVLIGAGSAALAAPLASPVAPAQAPVMLLAHTVASILHEDFFVVPHWAAWSGLLGMFLVGLYLVLLLPRLATGAGAWLSLFLLLALLAAHFGLLLGASLWLPLIGPSSLLLLGCALSLGRRSWLGAASAPAVFVQDGAAPALHVMPVVPLSVPAATPAPPAGPQSGDGSLPRLGRYVIDRVLGKGAMGKVYQGHDPQINRPLAIKTMALVQEFDEDALGEVRQRFFREAESAGRLNHPHIVTIYDAGEVDGLAYIAMEFVPGRDLVAHTRPDALLPLAVVLSIGARVADALDYAHRNHVVHRDIKPANIMYAASDDRVKVTDFGIARITDSSRTRTGMVLGSPSYMAPEQLAGKRMDGRIDLYSLGVTLYQLLSGRLPFTGDSLGKLMFSIANEAPFDILTIKPDLPAGIVAVVAKALNKNPDLRYQQGAEMAAALRACLDLSESTTS